MGNSTEYILKFGELTMINNIYIYTHTQEKQIKYNFTRVKLKCYFLFLHFFTREEFTETEINMQLAKAWTAIDRLSIIWKSVLTNKMKCSFFQAGVVLILLHGRTTWMLTNCMEKKFDANNTRMLRAILNKSWRQHSTKQQLYGHLPPIMKIIKIR